MKLFVTPRPRAVSRRPWLARPGVWILLVLSTGATTADDRGVEPVRIRDSEGSQVALYAASHALVIGVADYTAGWADLPGVEADVMAVIAILEEHGFEVRSTIDSTSHELISAVKQLVTTHGQVSENRLLFYFAGHGFTDEPSGGVEMGYFVPSDAPDPVHDRNRFLAKALPMAQVEVFAKMIKAKHTLFIFDSCFSGSIFGRTRAAPAVISYKTGLPVRQFITSGSAEEMVPDDSIFRQQLIRGLKGEADSNGDHYVTATELGELLQARVIEYSRGTQHPQYGKIRHPELDQGDFVFELPPGFQSADPGSRLQAEARPEPRQAEPAPAPPDDAPVGALQAFRDAVEDWCEAHSCAFRVALAGEPPGRHPAPTLTISRVRVTIGSAKHMGARRVVLAFGGAWAPVPGDERPITLDYSTTLFEDDSDASTATALEEAAAGIRSRRAESFDSHLLSALERLRIQASEASSNR